MPARLHQYNGKNLTDLNFKRPTFPLVVVPSGNASSGRLESVSINTTNMSANFLYYVILDITTTSKHKHSSVYRPLTVCQKQ